MDNCRNHKCVCKPTTLAPSTTLSTIPPTTSNNPRDCIEGRPCLSHQTCGVTVGSGICDMSTKKCLCKPTTVECIHGSKCTIQSQSQDCGDLGWCNSK